MALIAVIAAGTLALWSPSPASAAGDAQTPADEQLLPMAAPDEGGAGTDQAGASEWIPFAVMLGPFLVLIVPLLWLIFRIDRSEGRE